MRVEWAFVLLASSWVPWALSALIVAAAVAIWLDFRWNRLEPVLQGLEEAVRVVEGCEGQAALRQRFPAIFRRLADNPVVGEAWRAFAPTLSSAPQSDDAVGYTRRPAESFDESLLVAAGINLRFYHAVPNLLVGVGLLFTFIGLVAALYFASAGVAAADVGQAQAALRELLAAATFKFVTSIAGLGSSLVFSWREKTELHRAHRLIGRFCSALEARMAPVSGESVAAAMLTELRSHGALLRRLTRDLFVRLPEGVEEGIAAEVGRAVQPLREALAEAAPQLRRVAQPIAEIIAAELAERVRPAPTPAEPPEPVPAPAGERP